MRARLPAFLALLGVAGCSFIFPFEDREVAADDGALDGGVEAGTIVGEGDTGTTIAPPRDGAPLDDGAAPDASAPDAAPLGPCDGLGQGELARSGNNQRCCGGQPTSTTSNEHCGGCGIACNPLHQCQPHFGYWACTGCALDGGGGGFACWTGCCSTAASGAGTCSPQFVCAVPACSDSICEDKSPKTSCHQVGIATFCGY